MKQKIKIIDKVTKKGKKSEEGVIIEVEKEIRDWDHFQAQLKYKPLIQKPKKGKGSFKRNKKVKFED